MLSSDMYLRQRVAPESGLGFLGCQGGPEQRRASVRFTGGALRGTPRLDYSARLSWKIVDETPESVGGSASGP